MSAPVELRIGMKIRDNDPHMEDRVLTITKITEHYVFAERLIDIRVARIGRHRIFTDGKPRRSGWSVVP